MDAQELQQLLEDPSGLKKRHREELESVIEEYPYFQAAHLLLARWAHQFDAEDREEILHRASLYVPDRKMLHHYIEHKTREAAEAQSQPQTSTSKTKEAAAQVQTQQSQTQNPEPKTQNPKPETSDKKPFMGWLEEMSESSHESKQKPAPWPGEENKSEQTTAEPDLAMPQSEEGREALEELKQSSKQENTETRSPKEMAKESVKENDNIVSETLAKIYAQQGNIDKAINIYEQLRLRYPEKNRYFDEKIKKLKKEK